METSRHRLLPLLGALLLVCGWQVPLAAQLPYLHFAPPDTLLSEPATGSRSVMLRLRSTAPLATAAQLRVYTAPWPGRSPSAQASPTEDFEALDTLLSWPAGAVERQLTVRIRADSGVTEVEEGFLLRLAVLSGPALGGYWDSLRVRIRANNFQNRVRVGTADTSIYEAAGTVALPVQISGQVTTPFGIYYRWEDETAVLGRDYTVALGLREGSLFVFSDSSPSSQVFIPCNLTNDLRVNGERVLRLVLTRCDAPAVVFVGEDTLRLRITDNDPTAVQVSLQPLGLRLYPNPAQHSLTLESETPLAEVQLLDIQGRRWRHWETLPAARHDWDIRELPRGLYLLQAQGPAGELLRQRLQLY